MITSSMDESPVLHTELGQVRGLRRSTIYDDSYYSFEGIPFAKPPLGELRFRSPQPANPWTGIRDCSSASYKPVQHNKFHGVVEGSEDCLYLNVYVKTLVSEQPLPVLVWIYGGRFSMGDCSRHCYGPDYFMQHEVIVVSFNYRVCSLGFLSLTDPELRVPGNAGLKDQVLALRWIKRNITYFNGDPTNITVFGNSSGSISAHILAVSEQTRGLFNKVILQSESILNDMVLVPRTDCAYRLAKQHGYQGDNIDRHILAFLQDLPAEKLVTHDLMNEEEKHTGYLSLIGPLVEPYESDDCVIPRSPAEMVRTAWSNEIPMLLGGTSFEGLIFYPYLKKEPARTAILNSHPEYVLPIAVRERNSFEEKQKMASKIIQTHFGDKEPGEGTLFEYLDLLSYKMFWQGFHLTALSRMTLARAPTYLYRFDVYSLDFNRYRIRFCGNDPVRGVAHADEIPYLFLLRDTWKLSCETLEYRTIQRMVGMWTAFAKYSNPNCKQIGPTVWLPLTREDPNLALNISDEVEMVQLPEASKLKVWDSILKEGFGTEKLIR